MRLKQMITTSVLPDIWSVYFTPFGSTWNPKGAPDKGGSSKNDNLLGAMLICRSVEGVQARLAEGH